MANLVITTRKAHRCRCGREIPAHTQCYVIEEFNPRLRRTVRTHYCYKFSCWMPPEQAKILQQVPQQELAL